MIRNRSPLAAATAVQLLIFVVLVSTARAQNVSQAPAPENPAAGAAPSGGGELQQVVVTGYLIPRIGEGPQPVTSYDQQYIKNTGYQNVTDVLQTLPSATGNYNPAVTSGFSFSPASASIALKGLPPNDTLVLVDGLRMPSFPFPQQSTAGAFNFVDINSIPLAAIDRIEILNDGGSATYGTDAVAGVVNLILKDQYQGADINNYYGISQRGDYEVYHGQFAVGIEQKIGHGGGSGGEPTGEGKEAPAPASVTEFVPKIDVVAAFDFYDQSPVLAKNRAFTDENFSRLSFRYPDHGDFPTTTGLFIDNVTGAAFQTKQGFNGVSPTAADFTAPYNTFTSAQNGLQIYPRETRIGGVVKLTYDVTPWLKLYDSFLIDRNEEVSSYGPNQGIYPPPFNPGIIVPSFNPFNPTGHNLSVVDLALNEFGVLNTDTTITTFRNVVGATVQLPHSFYIDSNYLYGESDATETMKNMFTFSGMQAALNGTLPGNVGQFFNPFADEFLFAPNQVFDRNKNLVGSIWEDIRSDISQFHTVVGTTDLFDLPSGSIGVAGGFEYRSEDYIQNDDQNSKTGNLTAIQFPVGRLINARRYIWSIFGEVDLPLLGNQWSWPGLRSLQLTVSDRQDYYSDFGSAAKPKFALLYKPFNDFTVQASYDESFVAPSLPQLFTVSGLPAEALVLDPKFPAQGQETVLNTTFGNPRLKPETAYMYYVRGIWTPGSSDPEHSWWGWLNGFSAYIDWFQLDQHQVFGTLMPQEVVNLGSAAPAGNFVTRNPVTGQISEVVNTYLNLGDLRSEGLEWGFTYNTKEYNWGKLELSYDATYLYSVKQQTVQGLNPNGTLFYRVFDYTDSALNAAPDLKMQASIFYSKTLFGIDTFRTGVTWHYIGSELDFNNSANGTNPPTPIGSFSPDQGIPGNIHTIGNWNTFDWQISYKFGQPSEVTPQAPQPGYSKEGKKIVGEKAVAPAPEGGHAGFWRTLLANTTITFGINNIFDTRPPLSVDNVITNFDPSSGASFIQRYFWFSIDKKF
ncbi:MAG: TonB-dependent receptor [Verrucomicrobia bacterium]|nr:TonB-dependent receptor [Verrucomicrobiota bacterium]